VWFTVVVVSNVADDTCARIGAQTLLVGNWPGGDDNTQFLHGLLRVALFADVPCNDNLLTHHMGMIPCDLVLRAMKAVLRLAIRTCTALPSSDCVWCNLVPVCLHALCMCQLVCFAAQSGRAD
jgi:hypothetical protein